MRRKHSRTWMVWLGLPLLLLVLHFLLPFGLFPKPPAPNCGPERWGWLDARFSGRSDVIAYIRAHQQELIWGDRLPTLKEIPEGTGGQAPGVDIDWQALEADIQERRRPGYRLYILRYEHPHCAGQHYTFKVTSFGLASLYGCCGI